LQPATPSPPCPSTLGEQRPTTTPRPTGAASERHADEPSDQRLVELTAAGDRAAFRALVMRHQDRVRHLAWNLVRDPASADDVAQEVFLRMLDAADRYRPRAKFTTWLYRMTVNLCHDHHRRRRRIVSLGPSHASLPARSAGDPLETAETVRRVRQAVDGLPRRQRTVLVLRRYEGLGHDEIAAVTGWSRSAVESLLVRAYRQLRRSLAPGREE
jgi:RNA polymerase sigma-70 factor (ECF subfamily)